MVERENKSNPDQSSFADNQRKINAGCFYMEQGRSFYKIQPGSADC
jgi:hypothetical protein